MKTMTLADARQNLSAVISDVEAFDEHVLITKNGRPSVVIISADEWEEIEETAFWRAVPGIHDEIAEARTSAGISLDQLLSERRATLQ